MIEKIKNFVDESVQELKRVNWPTRDELVRYTGFVIGFSLVFALYLGAIDFMFREALMRIVA